MAANKTNWPQNIPTSSISSPSKKLTQIGIFGLKICHLANLCIVSNFCGFCHKSHEISAALENQLKPRK
jgi:hypothetical protein